MNPSKPLRFAPASPALSYVARVSCLTLVACGGGTGTSTVDSGTTTRVDAGPSVINGTWASSSTGSTEDLVAVAGSGANDLVAVGTNQIRTYNGSGWSGTQPAGVFSGIALASSTAGIAVGGEPAADGSTTGSTALAYRRGSSGAFTMASAGTGPQLNAAWLSGAMDGWAVGTDTILHYTGTFTNATPTPAPGPINAVSGSGPSDVYAVGAETLHYDGTAWTVVDTGANGTYFNSVWAGARDDVWIVGLNGAARHFDGTSWSNQASGAGATLYGVWGSAANNVWAVGGEGSSSVIVHWNGSRWERGTVPAGAVNGVLRGVWGSSASDIWAVGTHGLALHYTVAGS